MLTGVRIESGLHGGWVPLASPTDAGLPGLRLRFDYEGRFAHVHYYNKESDLHRGGPTCPHRRMGYDYSGFDYMNRVVWVKLLHSFTLMHRPEHGVKRTRTAAIRDDEPPPPRPPPGLSSGGTDCGGTAAPSMID